MREPFDLPLGRHGGEGAGGGTSGACETGHTITPRGDDTARVRAAAAAAAANSGPIGTTVLLTTGLHAVVYAGLL